MTIFVTIGTQEPFDRLVKAIDEFAVTVPDITVIAQVSNTSYKAKSMKALEFIEPAEFNNYFKRADLIVSHAGMGTILSALSSEKPILIMPRLAELGEHRNNHQLATAREFDRLKYVYVAYNELELKEKLITLLQGSLKPLFTTGSSASKELLQSLKSSLSLIKK